MYDVNRLRAILLRAAFVLGLAWVLAVPVGAARAESMNLEQCLERALAESLAVKQAPGRYGRGPVPAKGGQDRVLPDPQDHLLLHPAGRSPEHLFCRHLLSVWNRR